MDHLKEDATIKGALKELVESSSLEDVVLILDRLAKDQSPPLQVEMSFPRRRTLAEEGEPPKLIPREN